MSIVFHIGAIHTSTLSASGIKLESPPSDFMEVSPVLITLAFEGHPIRCFEVSDVMEWVAADVCAAVQLSGSTKTKALERLVPDEKVTRTAVVLGSRLQLVTVTESGLYHLISHSDKTSAKRFKRWLCREVLPAINPGSKDGSIEAALAAADRQIQKLRERLELALV